MPSIDISTLDKENHDYAVHLATYRHVLYFENGTFLLDGAHSLTSFESVDFWRDIALAAEILLKASLLRHKIPFFKKRAHGEYGVKVTALHNPWLNETLQELQIDYLAQINTGTVSTALKSAETALFGTLDMDIGKTELVSKMIYIIIRTRRNRNSHFFFPNQGTIDMAEVEMLYLPLLNLLEEIYTSAPAEEI